MNFPPAEILIADELEQFREKTTEVSRKKWKALCAQGKSPTPTPLGVFLGQLG